MHGNQSAIARVTGCETLQNRPLLRQRRARPPLLVRWLVLCSLLCGCQKTIATASITESLEVTPQFTKIVLEDDAPLTRTISLVLTNRGTPPLRIISVQTSCGCTVVGELPKMPILSGQVAMIEATVTLPQTGTKTSRLKIDYIASSRSSQTALIELHGKSPELPYAKLKDHYIHLVAKGDDRRALRRFFLETVEKADSMNWVAGVRSGASWLSAKIKAVSNAPTSENGIVVRTYEIELAAEGAAEMKSASLHGQIEFLIDPAFSKDIASMLVDLDFVPAIRVIPSRLLVPQRLDGSEVVVRKIAVIGLHEYFKSIDVLEPFPDGVVAEKQSESESGDETVAVFAITLNSSKFNDDEVHRIRFGSHHSDVTSTELTVVRAASRGPSSTTNNQNVLTD